MTSVQYTVPKTSVLVSISLDGWLKYKGLPRLTADRHVASPLNCENNQNY